MEVLRNLSNCWTAVAAIPNLPRNECDEPAAAPIVRRRTAGRPRAAFFGDRRKLARCPFNETNTSSPEFLKKLVDAYSSGVPMEAADGFLRILILYPSGFIGEEEEVQRMKECFAKHGQECCVCAQSNISSAAIINPSCAICMDVRVPPIKGVPCAIKWHANRRGQLRSALRYGNIFCGTPNAEETVKLPSVNGKKPRMMYLCTTTTGSEFCDSEKRRLFYCGANWDALRSRRYAPLYKKLDATDYFDVYGPSSARWREKAPASYRGYASNVNGALRGVMQKAGIALVLHADDFIRNGGPTLRIFEAAAASCVIISDKHPFVMENFGDSVFYVNQNASPEIMFQQIDGYVQWTLANPEKAKEMARRSHDIFMEKFTLEEETKKIIEFFKKLIEENKSKGQKKDLVAEEQTHS